MVNARLNADARATPVRLILQDQMQSSGVQAQRSATAGLVASCKRHSSFHKVRLPPIGQADATSTS